MRIDVITCQPDFFKSILTNSILGRAISNKCVDIHLHNLHNWALDKYKHIDDKPFGGEKGMLIKCQPVFDCILELKSKLEYDEIIYMTPDAPLLTQSVSNKLSMINNIIILCGHYKGIDQRIRDSLITMELSIGDYILTGGEIASVVLIDSVVRLIPGVLGDMQSALTDSFIMDGLLEAPLYTQPAVYRGLNVPDVLLSGNHKRINEWKAEQAHIKTSKIRPDLLEN